MTNKLVVIISSPKVPKINKILLYEMKFLVPNYCCLQNPWLVGYRPPDPRSLCPLSWTEFFEPPAPGPNKIPGYATGRRNHSVMFAHFNFSEMTSFSRNFHEYYASEINQASYFFNFLTPIIATRQSAELAGRDVWNTWKFRVKDFVERAITTHRLTEIISILQCAGNV